ncbi:hypothetical protein Cgig2_003056 [Carnegiea gigantea]|uniref:Uncharacterized protein n=1 Tax=Carnegiea gigantea TaxID=171969 RepID=A0A9Q1JT00_9CARY|nr:hypothetical protein Cgig2_003056 [Carnegiea gigantea]
MGVGFGGNGKRVEQQKFDKVQREAGVELRVFGDDGYLTTEVSRKLGEGWVGTSGVVIGKILDGVTGMVVAVVTLSGNKCTRCCCRRQWWGERASRLCVMGWRVGGRKFIVLKKRIGVEEVRMVTEIPENDLSEQKLWYSLKYDGGMLMVVEGDVDVRMFFKGNDKHGYLYMGGNHGSKRRAQKVGARQGGKMGCCCARGSGLVTKRGGCVGDHLQSRLRLGGGIIELSNDDEVSVASNDMGDDETSAEGVETGSKESGEAWEEDGQAQPGHSEVEEWGGERIEKKLTNTYEKVGCTVAVECYSLMLGEYSEELTNSCKLMLVYPMETHDMGKVDEKMDWVVGEEELDDNYERCILPPNNRR